jgi:transposase
MNSSKTIVNLGIDLGKNVFHLWGVNEVGERVLKKKVRRSGLLRELANRPPCVIGIEACGGAHYWARELTVLGHDVRMMAPQFVKPYVKGNKNDYNDAEAICEAVGRKAMRFVAVKSVEQQDLQALHRLRQAVVKARTALVNQIRGELAEYGIVVAKGIGQMRRALPEILEDGENGLSDRFRALLAQLYEQLQALAERIDGYNQQVDELYRSQASCQRIAQVEGIGPLTATAIVATFGDGQQFDSGRQLSAALGLVPRQSGTGGKTRLLGISKRGDRYIRTLLIHGARSVVQSVVNRDKVNARSAWIKRLVKDRGKNRAAVALANKNARIVWALLSRGEVYRVAT